MALRFTVLVIHYGCFPHISTIPLYFATKSVLLFILCILYKLKNLQAKIYAYKLATEYTLQGRVKLSITENLGYCFS